MRSVAVVPVKEKSDRVASKNFRSFVDGMSLFELKLKQISHSGCFDTVYISSNSVEAERLSRKYGCEFIPREDSYCSNDISWSDVIFEVISSLPEPETTAVAWCHTTSPLFTRYKDALEKYQELLKEVPATFDGLTCVTEFSEFLLTSNSRPFNYTWGVWHDYSQHMEKLYRVTGALFIASKATMLKNRYVMSNRPYLFVTEPFEGLDVDTPFDFQLAQMVYKNLEELTNATKLFER